MSDKTINLLLTLAAIGLVIYGIYSMTNKKTDKDSKDKTEVKEAKFNYKEELELVDNFVLEDGFTFDNELKLRIAISNVSDKDYKKSDSSLSDIKYYEFSGYYIKESTMTKLLKDLFGKGNYELKSFYNGDSYYLYNKSDKCYYVFYSTLVTNCANSVETDVVTNCIDASEPYCVPEYKQDDTNIIVKVGCVDNNNYIMAENKDFDRTYSYEYVYSLDKKNNDYYISDIKLIKE